MIKFNFLLFDNKEEQSIPVAISDNELLEQFYEINKMDDEKKTLIKRFIAMAINPDTSPYLQRSPGNSCITGQIKL